MIDVDRLIGSRLVDLRSSSGVSQAYLAREMVGRGFSKWSQATVWSVEAGRRPIRLSEAIALATILGATVSDFNPNVELRPVSPPTTGELIEQLHRNLDALHRGIH